MPNLIMNCISCGRNPIVQHNHCEICFKQKVAKINSVTKSIKNMLAEDSSVRSENYEQKLKKLISEYNMIADEIGFERVERNKIQVMVN